MNIKFISEEVFNELKQEIARIHKAIKDQAGNREIVYDNADAVRLLKVSIRTLATWREEGIIKYSQIGKKIYYRYEDIQEMLDRNSTNSNNS